MRWYDQDASLIVLYLVLFRNIRPEDVKEHIGQISRATVYRILAEFDLYGTCRSPASQRQGAQCKIPLQAAREIEEWLTHNPQFSLDEFIDVAAVMCDEDISTTAAYDFLSRINVTRKNLQYRHPDQDQIEIAAFLKRIAQYDLDQLVFLDESSFDRRSLLIPKKGWAKRGKRAKGVLPKFKGGPSKFKESYGVLCIASVDGVEAVVVYRGAMNGRRFKKFVRQTLVKRVGRGGIMG
eukprot:2809161-Rhodomonas_salina.1